jgi:hypothetical protein
LKANVLFILISKSFLRANYVELTPDKIKIIKKNKR